MYFKSIAKTIVRDSTSRGFTHHFGDRRVVGRCEIKNNFKSTYIFELDKTDKVFFYVCNLGLTLSNIFNIILLGDSNGRKMSKLW